MKTPWADFTDEQRRAAFLVDRHVLASAGAGSGKTTVMAVRYVACLLQGALLPAQILALAFTVEAAGNLRARIDRTLRQVLRAGVFPRLGDDEDFQFTDAERTHLRRCLAELPGAPITTIDGACLNWVREGAAQLGRDPETGPAEAVTWAQIRERAWLRLRREATGELEPLIARHGEHQVRHGLLSKLDQAGALPSGRAETLPGDRFALLLQRRSAQLAQLPAALAEAGHAPLPADRIGLLERLQELDSVAARGKGKEAIRDLQDLLDYPNPRRADGGRPTGNERRRRGSLLTLVDWDPALEADLAAEAQGVVELVARLRSFVGEESAAAGVAGFSAISAEAMALLRDPSTVRRLARRYRHVLLDEVQDLNRLQASLVEALLDALPEDPPAAAGPRVFAVGDHRQSIFGFRHAAPEIFSAWETSLPARGGTVATLRENFRSHPGLVLGITALFADAAFRPEDIKPGRTAAGTAVLAAWRVVAPEDAVEVQPHFVAEGIAASKRPPEDHAVLLRSRTHMAAYARALEARGIACDTDFPEGLIDSQEVADVEAILRLALAPHDRDALAVAVGGPWGTADANDKCLLVTGLEGDPRTILAATALGEIVAATAALAAEQGPAVAVRALAMDPRLTARYGRRPLARRRLANLMTLADEEQAAGRTLDLAAFCQRLRDRRRHGVDEAGASGAALGGRGVRLMTIHGAKGLEWPVVWLPELDRAHGTQDQRQAFLAVPEGEVLRLAVKRGPHDQGVSLAAEMLIDDIRVRQIAEERRLFYVACTRARDELHLVLEKLPHPPDQRGLTACPGGWVSEAWQEVVSDPQARTTARASTTVSNARPPALILTPATQSVSLRSVTELVEALPPTAGGESGGPREEWLRKLIGTTVHEAFARYGVGMSPTQATQSLSTIAALIPAPRRESLLAALTDGQLIPGYWEGERLIEQPLIGEYEGQVITAQIDLLLKREGRWHLYDFKTGNAAHHQSGAAQVRLYAELLAPLLDAPLAGVWLVDVERRALIAVERSPGLSG